MQTTIEGEFSVELDYENGRGALLWLNARVVEAHEFRSYIVEENGERKFGLEYIPIPIESYGRERNFDWLTGDTGWEGYLLKDGEGLELTSNLASPEVPNSPIVVMPDGYTFNLQHNHATLSISHNAIDYTFGLYISNAILAVPEPTAFTLTTLLLLYLALSRSAYQVVRLAAISHL